MRLHCHPLPGRSNAPTNVRFRYVPAGTNEPAPCSRAPRLPLLSPRARRHERTVPECLRERDRLRPLLSLLHDPHRPCE